MKWNKRTVALLVSLMVLLTVAVGVTVAYIIDRTESVENTFTPSRVACEVLKGTNHSYTVKNIGDTTAYIRASVLVNWKNNDGHIYAKAPEFKVTLGDGWFQGSDGYFYYTKAAAAGTKTDTALTVEVLTEKPDDSLELVVEVIASAVQATTEAVEAWSNNVVTVKNDGTGLIEKTSSQ